MRELRELGSSGPIAEFVETQEEASPSNSSGVSLRIDDYWLAWFQRIRWLGWHPHFGPSFVQREMRTFFRFEYDFSARPPDWDAYCASKGRKGSHPVSIIVLLRRPHPGRSADNWRTEVGDHPIVCEYRPEAFAHSIAGGAGVTGTSTGTLGGYLWHTNEQEHYAISCQHVLGATDLTQASTVHALTRKSAKISIGNVIQSVFPPQHEGKCNNRIQPGSLASPNSVDAAVVDLSGHPTIDLNLPGVGKIVKWTDVAQMGQGDSVTFTGYASGTVKAKIKECNIWKEIDVKGQKVCFGDLFVLEHEVHQYVPQDLSKPGDSGAWIINTQASIASWDGMLIGGDGVNAYCAYAENTMKYLDSHLVIPP